MALPDQVIYSTQDVGNMRHCNGNPNTVGVYGEPGWTCQDWTNGFLYVHTETTAANAWTQVMTDGGPSTGGDGTVFVTAGGYAQWSSTIADYSGISVLEWDVGLRRLYDAAGTPSVNCDTRDLYDSVGGASISYNTRQLTDSFGNGSINYDNRSLYDFTSTPALDFGSRLLINDDASIAGNWASRQLYGSNFDGNGNTYPLIDWTLGFAKRVDPSVDGDNNPIFTNQTAPLSACGTQRYVPASGATVTPSTDVATDLTVFIDTAATLASLTVHLKTFLDKAPDGARVTIFTRSAITALTVTAAGYTVYGNAVTTLAVGSSLEYVLRRSVRDTYVGVSPFLLRLR